MDTHKNAPLTPKGREAMVRIVIEGGVTKAAAAHQFNTTAKTVAKWVERFRAEGVDGLRDRSSKPHSLPSQTPPATCAAVEALRRQRHTGKQIAAEVGVSTATVSRILRRLGLNRLSALEPAEPSRRFQRENPGELIHIDIKKLGKFNRIGHRITGDRTGQSNPRSRGKGPGWEYVHVCIDDASRIAFSQVMKNEKKGCALASRRMSRKTAEAEFVYKPDLNRTHPPIDETVKLPRQVRLAVERAEELIAGKQPRSVEVVAASAKSGFPYTDAQIDAALAWLKPAKLDSSDPEYSSIVVELAREGGRVIKDRRRGAQKPRKASDAVVRRVEALLQAFRQLPSGLQQHPTGRETIERLRSDLIQKLGLRDDDDVLSEDTIRQDIGHLRPLIRLVQERKMPPPGQRPSKAEPSEQTLLEMEAGRRAVARAEANPDLWRALIDPETGFEK